MLAAAQILADPAFSAVCPLSQLSSIGLPNEEQYRRDLREMLFTAPDVATHISGVVGTSTAPWPTLTC